MYLLHIRDAVERIVDYTRDGKGCFLADSRTQDAVIRNLEIIGEATKQLSEDLKAQRPEVPWKRVAGMRDKMIHDYFGVDLEIVWGVVENHVPVLKNAIAALLTGA